MDRPIGFTDAEQANTLLTALSDGLTQLVDGANWQLSDEEQLDLARSLQTLGNRMAAAQVVAAGEIDLRGTATRRGAPAPAPCCGTCSRSGPARPPPGSGSAGRSCRKSCPPATASNPPCPPWAKRSWTAPSTSTTPAPSPPPSSTSRRRAAEVREQAEQQLVRSPAPSTRTTSTSPRNTWPPRWTPTAPWTNATPPAKPNSPSAPATPAPDSPRSPANSTTFGADGKPDFIPPRWLDPHQKPRRNHHHYPHGSGPHRGSGNEPRGAADHAVPSRRSPVIGWR